MKVYNSVSEFQNENEARLGSLEYDFGVHWKSKYIDGTFRVSWIRDTGEFYAFNFKNGKVYLFEDVKAKTPGEAKSIMKGWYDKFNPLLEDYFPEVSR